MQWVKKHWLWFAGLLLAVGFAILGRDGRRAKIAEAKIDELLEDATEASLAKAEKETVKAEKAKQSAKQSAEVTRQTLETISDKDTDMADLLTIFERVRK